MANLDFLIEQLWATALQDERLRVVVDQKADPKWSDLETYWLVPDAERATLLVPRGQALVTAAAIETFNGLRPIHVAAAKRLAALGARARLPVSLHRLSIQVRREAPREVADSLPLSHIEHLLGRSRLAAAIGVRTGDNRKPTLALFDHDGGPAGFAKLGWDPVSDEAVANETEVLRDLKDRGASAVAVPEVVASGDYAGHPVQVTAPLPVDAHGGRRHMKPPTAAEIHDLMPVVRNGPPVSTRHVRRLSDDVASHAGNGVTATIAAECRVLLNIACKDPRPLPVSSRWHGDFTEWNVARDGDGRLWVWDWESSEPDALAGLDALHWSFSRRRLDVSDLGGIRLVDCVADASPLLRATGVGRSAWPLLAAVYVVAVVERACALAASRGTWSESWIDQDVLSGLIGQARGLLPQGSPGQ